MRRRQAGRRILEAGLIRRYDQRALVLAVSGAALTLCIMVLVLAVPALDACAPSGTPALECLSQSLRARLPFAAAEQRSAIANPPLPPHDPRKTRAAAPVDVPADMPVIPPASPEMLKVDLPVLSPIGPAQAAMPPEIQPLRADTAIVPAVDPVTANAVPAEPATEIANVTPHLPVTPVPEVKPPMPEPLAAAAPAPEAAPAPAQPPATEAAVLPPTIDTIQIGGIDNFVAGDAPEGSTIQLYLDDKPAGESDVQEGRWLVEGVELSTAPQQILKVEAIDPATGKVLGTGAISVEIELPDDEQLPPVDDGRDPPSTPDETTPAAPDAPAAPPEETPQSKPLSELAVPAISPPDAEANTAPEAVSAPRPLPPLAPVKPRRGSASVQLFSNSGQGSFVTLGK